MRRMQNARAVVVVDRIDRNKMSITNEIENEARNFGRCLKETSEVGTYQKAVQAVKEDSNTIELERKFNILYQRLASQEQSGQSLDQTEVTDYYQLRDLVRRDPLISAREDQLQMVKLLFADAGQAMTSVLGIDFTILAL